MARVEKTGSDDVYFRKINKMRPLFQEVVAQIKKRVINGSLKTGEMLPPERVMAEQFGVSRTVIREAMKALELQGLVEVLHGRGIKLASPSMESVIETMVSFVKIDNSPIWALHEMRSIIETEIAGLAALRRTEEEIQGLKEILGQMSEKTDSPNEYSALDIKFHRALMTMTHNPLFPMVLEPFSELMLEARRIGALATDAQKRSLESHSEIVRAIEDQDAERAKYVMREHFEKVASFVSEAESKHETTT